MTPCGTAALPAARRAARALDAGAAVGARGILRQRVPDGWCMTCEDPCGLLDPRRCAGRERQFAWCLAAFPTLLGRRQTLKPLDDRLMVVGGVPDWGEALPKGKVLTPKAPQRPFPTQLLERHAERTCLLERLLRQLLQTCG